MMKKRTTDLTLQFQRRSSFERETLGFKISRVDI
jgi:hypothetical protein